MSAIECLLTLCEKVFSHNDSNIVNPDFFQDKYIPQRLERREDKNCAFVGKVGSGTRAILSTRTTVSKEFMSWALVLWGLSPIFGRLLFNI